MYVRPYGDVLREYGLKYYLDEPDTNASHFKYMFSPNFIKWCKGEIKGESMGKWRLNCEFLLLDFYTMIYF